jgi:hypothetical protein
MPVLNPVGSVRAEADSARADPSGDAGPDRVRRKDQPRLTAADVILFVALFVWAGYHLSWIRKRHTMLRELGVRMTNAGYEVKRSEHHCRRNCSVILAGRRFRH